ncbi:MAG: DNA gyrase subunit A [Deferribacteres bacterium]|nr:DNA gyrase subunit A [candidate division KSB1 bacterium]MCB9502907.1 DNA gyrase subunit A [Deferribacteres bacterium]
METNKSKVIPVLIEQEMRESYINYAMSVIVSRALPDVRDGLKPVHRRVLYGMRDLNLRPGTPYKKSARIVGEVLGKYHPHGDSAVYDTMVRMVQDFSLRYPLVDGQGNFGSVDGDPPAAMRYTEARMAKIAEEMLRDIEKETVDFKANFDESLEEPTILPAVIPNLLVNGASGIAVGMATNIPPHNLTEVVNAVLHLIKNPEAPIEDLMLHVKGPDFPTGAQIYGEEGIDEAYRSGRGTIRVRAVTDVEDAPNDRQRMIVTELPYQVNKKNLIEKIADLVREKKVEGISDIRDESDREGMRIVLELKRDAKPKVILNVLFKHTQMQSSFGINMLALVNGRPVVLNLKQIIEYFIEFRHEVVVRRTEFDLDKAEKRAHILEGLKICLDNIDAIVELIKKSSSPETARQALMDNFPLSEIQAQAILDMRLQRLTGLERDKIEQEYRDVIALIEQLRAILANRELRMQIIADEMLEIKEKYGDERRTEIVPDAGSVSIEDMIIDEDVVITMSHKGFVKRLPITEYRTQSRGGRGASGSSNTEEDFVQHLFVASTHSHLLIFTDRGRCYWLKVWEIPVAGKGARGRAIVNLLELLPDEKIRTFINVREFDDEHFILMATKKGIVKKTPLSSYSRPRRGGINAITIREDDDLLTAELTNGEQDIILATQLGKTIRFSEKEVRSMGRTASGVKGISLKRDNDVVGMVTVKESERLLIVTGKGYGKRCNFEEFPSKHRGGQGVIALKVTDKVGKLIAIQAISDDDDFMIITKNGIAIRQKADAVSIIGRNTQGVKLIRLDENDDIADVARITAPNESEAEDQSETNESANPDRDGEE